MAPMLRKRCMSIFLHREDIATPSRQRLAASAIAILFDCKTIYVRFRKVIGIAVIMSTMFCCAEARCAKVTDAVTLSSAAWDWASKRSLYRSARISYNSCGTVRWVWSRS